MQRPHRDILPASPLPGQALSNPGALPRPNDGSGDQQLPKRRRRNVRVACNGCRARKAACDGKRPVCARCSELNIACEYISRSEDETSGMALKHQLERLRGDLKQHADLLEHLQSIPEPEAIAVIRRLRSTRNPASVLSSIKRNAQTTVRPSVIETARAIQPHTASGVEFELRALHHAVYPALVPLQYESINLDSLFSSGPRRLLFGLLFEDRMRSSSDPVGGSPSAPSASIIHVGPPSPLRGASSRQASPVAGPVQDREYCDSRLNLLDTGYWTKIPISNEFAASVLSYYLENYHPIFGCFDPDLFLSDLVEQKLNNCSAFLFSALMSLACQSYCTFDVRSSSFSVAFLNDAEKLRQAERNSETPLNLAAMCHLAQAAIMNGKETLAFSLTNEVLALGIKLELFGVHPSNELAKGFHELSSQKVRQLAHTAWGAYAWVTFHGTHFEVDSIEFPPVLPIPGNPGRESAGVRLVWPSHPLPSYMGQTFTTLCKFWVILQGIGAIYTLNDDTPLPKRVPIAVAEGKYQELLAWADILHPEMLRGEHNPCHVFFFHAIYHCTVLTIFRPFVDLEEKFRLRSFSSTDSTPSTILSASLNQLKRLLYDFHTQSPVIPICGWFNIAVIQVSSAVLKNTTGDPYWKIYFRLCFQFWKEAYVRYPVVLLIAQANMSLALQLGGITSAEAKAMMDEVRSVGRHHDKPEEAVTSALLDFEVAMLNPQDAKIDVIAKRFDELVMFDELTSGDFEKEISYPTY